MIYNNILKKVRTENLKDITNIETVILIGKLFESNFVLNESNFEFYNQLILYSTRDSLFKKDLNKGLLLMGNIGTGKSLAMKIMHIFKFVKANRSFEYFESDEIIDSYCKEGRVGILKYNTIHDLLIDELGNDSGKQNNFGNIEDPISLLLNKRYNDFINPNSKLYTHAITNLDEVELNNRFDERIIDRIYEMFNIIPVIGNSWRRRK